MQRVIREQEPVKPSTKLSTRGETVTDIAKCRNCTPDLLRKAIRGDLDWIVMKSLEKNRVRRYETASGLAEDIRRHLEHEPILARGPSTTYRLGKFLHRHRWQTIAALATAVIVGAAAVLLSLWNRDRLQLAEAEGFRDQGILSQAREQYARAEREAALETIRPILKSRHVGPEAQLLQASILVDNRRSDEAVTILNDLLDAPSAIAGAAHALLVRILWENESPEAQKRGEIEEHRRQAETLLPETAEAYFLRAITAAAIKEQLTALDKALQLDPKHYESLRLRAYTYYASRKYEKMKDDALAMVLLRLQDPLGYSLRAAARRELGHYSEAIADFDSALARTAREDPQYLDLATQRCETLLRMGSYEWAVSEGQAHLSQIQAKDLSLLQHHVFCALTALGDYDRATDLYRQMVGPGQESRRLFRERCEGYVSTALRAGRSWHPPGPAPTGAAFLPLVEAEEIHQARSAKARRIEADGFNACWSPDGQKLAYSLGARGASGIAVYDLATNETELLILAGRDPKWSPNGRYIAFVRDRQSLHISELLTARYQPRGNREIWVMKADGTEPRRLADGMWPSWGKDSTFVYTSDATYGLKSIAIDGRQAEPKSIAACSPGFHSVSPDNRYLAHFYENRFMVKDLDSNDEIAEWRVPFSLWGGPGWSPGSDELCLGSNADERTGLWFFRLGQKEPLKTLDGVIMNGAWSPDGRKLAFDTGRGIWVADLGPKVSASESLGPAQTLEEHSRHMVRLYTRRIEADPEDADAYSARARYYGYLGERDKAEADMKKWSIPVGGQSPADSGYGTPRVLRHVVDCGPPVNLGPTINSKGAHAPCVSADGLELYFHRQDPSAPRHIYVSRRATPDSEWGVPVMLGAPIDVPSGGSIAPSLSADGLSLYYDYPVKGDRIYVAKRATTHNGWEPPVSVGDVVNKGGACTPCISADELELYFFSWRPGGYGDADLWVTTRATVNDEWGTPVNLGPTINTPHYEGYPGISPDGLLLFFGSGRPGGAGGHDLYVTRRATKRDPWGPPVNLGPLINSASHETGPKVSFDGSMLYFYSNRPDGYAPPNEADIWQAPIIRITDLNGHSKVPVAGTVLLVANWGKSNSVCDIQPMPWADGGVDIEDLKVFMTCWQKAKSVHSQNVR